MRTFKLTLVALLIGTTTLLATTTNPDPVKAELRSQIIELLHAPDFTVEQEVTVNIEFTFSSQGEVVVLRIDSYDKEVIDYVRENLNYKKIDNPGTTNKLYLVPLKLKGLK
jgi:hypothetical protein